MQLAAMSVKGDPLEMTDRVVSFESFRCEIEAVVLGSGRERINVVVMFRMLVAQWLYDLPTAVHRLRHGGWPMARRFSCAGSRRERSVVLMPKYCLAHFLAIHPRRDRSIGVEEALICLYLR
jgi:hypothetical protein